MASLVAVLVAVAVVIATVVFLFLRGGAMATGGMSADSIAAGAAKEKVTGVVLVGSSGSGKTVLLHRLCSGNVSPKTVPSMVPAYHACVLPSGKQLQLVDTPGHERMESSVLQHIKGAKGVALVVDATSSKAIKQAARLLFTVLSSDALSASTPLLVFCNKSDLPEAKGSDRVKLVLQKEIDEMRKTRGTMGVADGDASGAGGAPRVLGVAGKPFKFEDEARPITVASGAGVITTSAGDVDAAAARSSGSADNGGGLGALTAFLESVA